MFKGLIVTGELGQLRYYEEVAKRFKLQGCKIGFCCDRDDPGVANKIQKVATKYNMDFFHHRETGDSITPSRIESVLLKINEKLFFNKLNKANAFASGVSKLKLDLFRNIHLMRLLSAKKILNEFKPDVIIIGEDGFAADYWMITAAKKLNIPVIVLPYGLADSSYLIHKGVEERQQSGELLTTKDPVVKIVKDLYPKWIKDTRHGEVLYLPPEYVLALEGLNINIPDPWCLQGGLANLLLLESESMYQRYLAEGISNKKMKIVGAVYCDVMYDAIVNNKLIENAYNNYTRTNSDQLNILVCIPPSDHNGWQHNCSYDSVAGFIIELKKFFDKYSNLNVLYSFHPRITESDRQAILALGIEDYPGFPLPTIPACDVLFTCGSSLARWGLAARKLVINYDLYRFGVNDYPDTPAHFYLDQMPQLEELINKINTDPEWHRQVLLQSKADSERMGIINGTAILSITNIIKEAIAA